MPRVKRGKSHLKKRRKLLAKTKGYRWGRKNLLKAAKVAVIKAGVHAYEGRKKKKRFSRALWQIKINAFTRDHGLSYARLMDKLKKNKIALDRKILADLAVNNKDIFIKILKEVQ